jgi:hypothetical protein
MRRADFLVSYNSETESEEVLGRRIIRSLFYGRLKQKKPATIFLGGDSGEGKSYAVLKIEEALLEGDGSDLKLEDYINAINVYTPLEYPTKLKEILWSDKYKPIHIIAVHEAREIVKAKLWQSFITQAISDVNAMSRSVKRLVTIIVSQFIRDITNDMRYTLNFYITADRPRGEHTRLYISVLYKDDRDIEKPRLRKRKIFGYIKDLKTGRKIKYSPRYISVGLPSKEVRHAFDKADREAKEEIIKRKLNRVIKEIELDMGVGDNKVLEMVKHYSENPENLYLIGKSFKGKFRVNEDFKKVHDITPDEVKQFQDLLSKAIINNNIKKFKDELETIEGE